MDDYELYNKILKASNIIVKKQRQNIANYIITSPQVSDSLNSVYEDVQKRIKQQKRIKKLKRILNEFEKQ